MESVAPEIKERKRDFAQAKSAPTKQDIAAQKKAEEKDNWWVPTSKKHLFNDMGELSPSAKLILLAMELHADKNGKCVVRIRKMAKLLNYDKDTVEIAVQELLEKEKVKATKRRGLTTEYFLIGFKNYRNNILNLL